MEIMTREKYIHLGNVDNHTFIKETQHINRQLCRYYYPDNFDFSLDNFDEENTPYRFTHLLSHSIIEYIDYSHFSAWTIQPEIIRSKIGELIFTTNNVESVVIPKFYNSTIKNIFFKNNAPEIKINFSAAFSGCTIGNVFNKIDAFSDDEKFCATNLSEMFYESYIHSMDLDNILSYIYSPKHIVNKLPLSRMFERAKILVEQDVDDTYPIDINLNSVLEDRIYPHDVSGLRYLFNNTIFFFYGFEAPFNIYLDALKFDPGVFNRERGDVAKKKIINDCKNMFNIIIDKINIEANPVVRFHMDSSWPIEILLAVVGESRALDKVNIIKTNDKTIVEITG